MSRFHLLWWIFAYLRERHPGVLVEMQRDLAGDEKHPWVSRAFHERLEAWRKSL